MSTEPTAEPLGWQVVAPDGTVVDSGPLIHVHLVAGTGEPEGA